MELMSSLQSGLDENKPSLFELLSEQQLSALIPPSIRYLLVLATQRYPRYLLRILNSFDEIHALAMVVVERHYLRTYGGGFTENFYGLKRERVLRIKGGDLPRTQIVASTQLRESLKLSESDIWKNIAVMVGIPYLKRKLDEAYEIYAPQAALLGPRYNRDTLPPDATLRQRLLFYYKWFIRKIYPSVNAAYYFSLLAFNLAYLFSNTQFSSPLLWLIQTRMRRLSAADHRAIALAAEKPLKPAGTPAARPGQAGSLFNPRTLVTAAIPQLLSSLKLLLPTSIFALKFLEWWHASDFARQLSRKAAEGLELPPPVLSELPNKPQENGTVSSTKATNSVSLGHPPGTTSAPTHTSTAPMTQPKVRPPISSESYLPILTVPTPAPECSDLCPICLSTIATPTATQTGYVFCYTCIFKWVDGSHERQRAWMEGAGSDEGWGEDSESQHEGDTHAKLDAESDHATRANRTTSREGKWESGKGRCAITGKRLLGGVECLRRIIV
ncbi:hypothetical protein MMC10_008475 [Thelotrema lepadinum]|nr:hypothetical protein [Thelotrema lepadinum]